MTELRRLDEEPGEPLASEPQPVIVAVDHWWARLPRVPTVVPVLFCVALGLIAWFGGSHVFALVAVPLVCVGLVGQYRYLIVEARLDDELHLAFLGGRSSSLDPRDVRLSRGRLGRVAFFGGFPLVGRGRTRLVGAFYPTLEWDDIDALDHWLDLGAAGG